MGARKYVLWRRGAARRLEWRTALRQAEPVVGCSRVVKTGTPAAQFSGGQTRRCASSRVCSGENSSLTHSGKERLCVVWTAGRNLTALLVEGRRFFFRWSRGILRGGGTAGVHWSTNQSSLLKFRYQFFLVNVRSFVLSSDSSI